MSDNELDNIINKFSSITLDKKLELDNKKLELNNKKLELDNKELELNKKKVELTKELELIKNELELIKKEQKLINSQINKKGTNSSKNGNKYEIKIHDIVKNTKIQDELFNTQTENELGGSSSHNDLVCNFNSTKNIGIEIKIKNTPDWMQCSLHYDTSTSKWVGSNKGKIPEASKNIFNQLLNNIVLFDNQIPPFIEKDITYAEWTEIKKNTNIWDDKYIDISNDTIKKMYAAKNCHYIQISDCGLYHLGNDICNFEVPEFIIEQRLRIRIKVHSEKNKKGFCDLSITAACQPKDIKKLEKSPYSLDNIEKLPKKLLYI
jgi:hypothetical protein